MLSVCSGPWVRLYLRIKAMKAWHFIRNDRRLGYGDNRIVKTGRTHSVSGDICPCRNGMHGSKRIIDALGYARGNIICRVDITGDIIEDDDKMAGRNRRVIWMRDVTNILHEFACRCAEDALKLVPKPDPRSIAAIKAKRDWLDGKIGGEELIAAERAASWVARMSALKADMKVSTDAAWAATSAAEPIAWYAAVCTMDASIDKQNRRLTAMVCAGRKQ